MKIMNKIIETVHSSIKQAKYYNTNQKYLKNTLYTITKMSIQHELPIELLLEIFSKVGRQS